MFVYFTTRWWLHFLYLIYLVVFPHFGNDSIIQFDQHIFFQMGGINHQLGNHMDHVASCQKPHQPGREFECTYAFDSSVATKLKNNGSGRFFLGGSQLDNSDLFKVF